MQRRQTGEALRRQQCVAFVTTRLKTRSRGNSHCHGFRMPPAINPFELRLKKPFWLLLCPVTGRSAAYSLFGDLLFEDVSTDLVRFAQTHAVSVGRIGDIHGHSRPRKNPSWFTPADPERCFLYRLRDERTPTEIVRTTPDR